MGFRGHEGVLQYEDTWTDGSDIPVSPTYTDIVKAVDVNFNGDRGEADGSSREADWVQNLGALKQGELTVGYRNEKADDAVMTKLLDSWNNGTPILVQYLNGTTTGDSGWLMPMMVVGYNEEQPNDGAAIANFTLNYYGAHDASGVIIQPSRVSVA